MKKAGEAIARIELRMRDGSSNFEGYLNPVELDKKVLRDVFAPGDAWMRSGDLMRKDARGFYYFVDRIGDTFRWKGENVATSEVAAAIASCSGVLEANVYGVAIAGYDGRAGMAAISVDEQFDSRFCAAHRQALARIGSSAFLANLRKPGYHGYVQA